VLGSDVAKLNAKLELRKDMMSDYKDRFEKATYELF
jgi:hypothetical protein